MLWPMSAPPLEQLPLALVAEPPSAPLSLRPMQPRRGDRLPVDGRHLFDISWAGLRVLAHVERGAVRLVSHGRDVSAAFPELAAALADDAPPGTILDGEIVVPDAGGRLDRAALRERVRGGGRVGPGAALVLSDVPWLGGSPQLAQPLRVRRARLAALRLDRPHIVVLEAAQDAGPHILAAARAAGLAAIVAKRLDAPYLPGVRSRLWRAVAVNSAELTVRDEPEAEALSARLVALLRPLPLGIDG